MGGAARYNVAMGYRLSKIYTRTGDAGGTGLGNNTRTQKDSARICAIGEVDELNCLLGVLLCEDVPEDVRALLIQVQHRLFDFGGELSIPGAELLASGAAAQLEAAIDKYNAQLKPLKEFILPGGNRAAAWAHLARGVCRRAERSLVSLAAKEPVSEAGKQYINRLSDLLFVLARHLNRCAGCDDVLWQKNLNAS